MMAVAEKTNTFLDHFSRVEKQLADTSWPALFQLRQAAIERFENMGIPGPRNEDWKFTSLASLAKVPFVLAEDNIKGNLPEDLMSTSLRLVFVNGHFSPKLSQLKGLPSGITVTSLAAAFDSRPECVEAHLAKIACAKDLPFTALNTAFLQDGAFISLPDGQVLEQPVELVYLSSPAGQPTVSHPRTLIVAGMNSQVTVVERYLPIPAGESMYFTNAVTEIVLADHASVDHYKLQQESRQAFHIANTQVSLGRSSNFRTHYVALGGGLVRNEVRVRFEAEGSEATVNGLYLAGGKQHIDNHTVIDHAKPHCASHELYKGILTDKAHGVFNGKIFVRQDAQKTDAKQTNQTLLLSEDAVINTKPQLEIFADDVKCTHGATVGNLNEESVFYLRTRGIGLEEARQLLTFAFANDVVDRIKIDTLRAKLEGILTNQV